VPQHRPKFSIVLGAVAVLTAASPFAVVVAKESADNMRTTNSTLSAPAATQIAEVVLAAAPDIALPFEDLTGLNLADLVRRGLQSLPLPPDHPLASAPRETPSAPADISAPANPAQRPDPPSEIPAPGAVTVKELTQDNPFRMVALTSNSATAPAAKVRAKQPDGTWGPWLSTTRIDTPTRGGTAVPGKQGTEPIYVGTTTSVQVVVPSPQTTALPSPAPDTPTPYVPAALATPLAGGGDQPSDVTAVLIDPGTGPAGTQRPGNATVGGPAQPTVISRAQWGADESLRCQDPVYDDFLGGAVVHHTAGSNDYSKEESADIIRGIYAYHAQTLGWCDIGYHVLVDKYGQIFEGRAGGLDKPVQGAHTGGFNENTVGIAMMGDYTSADPTQEEIDSVGRFLGWRLNKAGLDPKGTTTMYSEGTEYTSYPQGAAVQVPIVSAHRDLGNTADPGERGYARMDEIRNIAAAYAASNDAPSPTPAQSNPQPGQHAGAETGSTAGDGLGNLPALASQLIAFTDQSLLAQKWRSEGAEAGPLGAAKSGQLMTLTGSTYADFTNGALYTSPAGDVVAVLGAIYQAWKSLGAATSELGLPVSDEYRVQKGMRSDFERGSLVFDELTRTVTKILTVDTDNLRDQNDPARSASSPVGGHVAP